MNGLLFEWKDKGHQIRKDGMLKVGKSLAWKLFLLQENGMRWAIYVDSHTGDIVLATNNSEDGSRLFSARSSDFRVVEGFRFPFKVEYLDADGNIIATEIHKNIEVMSADFEDIQSSVSH